MKKTLILCALLTGCVSAKKHNALLFEYQACAERSRSIRQETAVIHADLQNCEAYNARIKIVVDSLTTAKKEVRHD